MKSVSSFRFFRICDKLRCVCEKSNMDMKHGACVFIGNKIITSGYNHTTRSAIMKSIVPSIHAEMNAIYLFLKQKRFFQLDHLKKVRKLKNSILTC